MFEIIQAAEKKKWVRLVHYTYGNFVITYIMGISDWKLIELAKGKLGFPRGFAVIWHLENDISEYITTVAFLSKFANDDRNDEIFAFDGLTKIKIAKKMSGSLGLLTAFNFRGESYVFVGAKNSTGNHYSKVFYDLIMNWYKDKQDQFNTLVKFLATGNVIAFEVCSNDPGMGHHGSTYKTSIPVALVIGSVSNNNNIVQFMEDDTAINLFIDLGLPVENRWILTDNAIIRELMNKIQEKRDFMTNSMFDDLIKEYDLLKGTISHAELSDVLEGLIIWLYYGDKKEIKKYKFANYTRMTMLMRPMMTSDNPLLKPGQEYNRSKVVKEAKNWASRWVVKPENRKEHVNKILAACDIISKYNTVPENVQVTQNNYLDWAENAIREADSLNYDNVQLPNDDVQEFNIILVIGNVGCGKSTLMKKLSEELLRVACVSVDDFDENTGNKGMTKNNNVLGTIIRELLNGKLVIVENGGGMFFNPKTGQVSIISELEKRLPVSFRVSMVLAPETIVSSKGNKQILTDILVDQTRDGVLDRLNRGVYTIKNNPSTMGEFKSKNDMLGIFDKVTKNNLDIQLGLLNWAENNSVPIIGFDMIPQEGKAPEIILNTEVSMKLLTDELCQNNLNLSKCLKEDPESLDKVKFTYGFMMETVIDGNKYIGHATCGYNMNYKQTEEFMWAAGQCKIQKVYGQVLYVDDGKKRYMCVMLMVNNADVFKLMPETAHMTINTPYSPAQNGKLITEVKNMKGDTMQMNIENKQYFIVKTVKIVDIIIGRPYGYALVMR